MCGICNAFLDLFDPIFCPNRDTLSRLIKIIYIQLVLLVKCLNLHSHIRPFRHGSWGMEQNVFNWGPCYACVSRVFEGPATWPHINKSYAIWVPIIKICLIRPLTISFVLVYLHNTMCFSIYGTGYVHEMYCTGPFLKFVVCDMSTFTQNASSHPGHFEQSMLFR